MINVINSPGTQVVNVRSGNMHAKKIYYVSHPFTGNMNEQDINRREAREITAWLKKQYPEHIFINPLDVFRYAELVPEWSYKDILGQCLELLKICNGVVMTGKWQNSNGCQREYQMANRRDMDIWYLKHWKKEYLNKHE